MHLLETIIETKVIFVRHLIFHHQKKLRLKNHHRNVIR
jgi:hypothetical protein